MPKNLPRNRDQSKQRQPVGFLPFFVQSRLWPSPHFNGLLEAVKDKDDQCIHPLQVIMLLCITSLFERLIKLVVFCKIKRDS